MEERDRFISSTKNMTDVEVENKLRPMSFNEYVGQEKIKANLNSFMYTETQEQYVNILYDVHHPKNVVYMRK